MKKLTVIGLSVILFLFLIQPNVFVAFGTLGNPLKKGDTFPEFKLTAPKIPGQQEYLGIQGKDAFSISDIQTKVVILQIFHSG